VYRSLWYIRVFSFSARQTTVAHPLAHPFKEPVFLVKELCFGQSQPGNVGLRNMLNGACSVRQGQ
jgi:hypothetical protein